MKKPASGFFNERPRPDESLYIGPDIAIKVLGIHGRQIRLGITAEVVIDRKEVRDRKLREPAAPAHS